LDKEIIIIKIPEQQQTRMTKKEEKEREIKRKQRRGTNERPEDDGD
jgi:hypothetical protein